MTKAKELSELASAATVTSGNVALSGGLDVDGVTDLDVVDIDGAVDMASTALVAGVLTANGGAVFNESSADVDFRVESNGNANMLFVDGGNDTVAIGTSDTDFDPVADNLIVGTGSGSNGITIYTGGSVGNKGSIFFADTAAGDATNSRKGQITYEQNNEIMTFFTADTKAMEIGFIGAVNMPKQPAFLVQPASTQSNMAINTDVNIAFGTERFDVGGNFASSVFTAPVDGKYFFTLNFNVTNLDAAANFFELYIVATGQTFVVTIDPDHGTDPAYYTFTSSGLISMDANDTCRVKYYQGGGAAQTDVITATHFSGYLVA